MANGSPNRSRLRSWKRRELGARASRDEAAARAAPPEPEEARAEAGPLAGTSAAESQSATFFTVDCQVDGKLVVETSIDIEGEFRGSISSPETVIVREGAAVEASIRARSILIRGSVVGDVRASREVVVEGTGRLHGNVETPSLVIERGAVFNGQTRMFRPEIAARARRHVPTPAPV